MSPRRYRIIRHPGPPPWRRRLRLALAALLGLALAWSGGLVWFVERIPRTVSAPDARTDAIVALTGGSRRLPAGFMLLAGKQAEKLFVSGVYRGVEVAELLELSKEAPQELECCVDLGYAAADTVGNARETARWMAGNGYSSLRLVTANYHMPRSLLEFRFVMPDARIVPHPVFPERVKVERWWQWPGTAFLIAREYTKYLLSLARQAALGLVGADPAAGVAEREAASR